MAAAVLMERGPPPGPRTRAAIRQTLAERRRRPRALNENPAGWGPAGPLLVVHTARWQGGAVPAGPTVADSGSCKCLVLNSSRTGAPGYASPSNGQIESCKFSRFRAIFLICWRQDSAGFLMSGTTLAARPRDRPQARVQPPRLLSRWTVPRTIPSRTERRKTTPEQTLDDAWRTERAGAYANEQAASFEKGRTNKA